MILADDGIDDERVASWSCDVGGMVPLIVGDRRLRPAEEGGDGRFGGACLPVAYLMLAFGTEGVGPAEDHDALLRFGETVSVPYTVECQVHMGGCVVFFRKGGCQYLQNTVGM